MSSTKLEALVDSGGLCSDAARIKAVAALFDLTLASPNQIRQGRALGARLISDQVTTAERLCAVQTITGASQFVHLEASAVTGALGFFPVRAAALSILDDGTFDARDFSLDLVARPGERPAATFAFGVVASTKAGGSAIIRASAAIQEALLWAMPIYTRVATDDGARVLLGSLGFARINPENSLVRRPPRTRPLEGFRTELAA